MSGEAQKKLSKLPVIKSAKNSVVAERTELPEFLNNHEVKSLRDEAISVKEDMEHDALRMGKILFFVKHVPNESKNPLWKAWGYPTFDEYCERELGFRERKGYHLLSIYEVTAKGILRPADVEKLGWSKASVIAPLASAGVITIENAHKWVETGEKSSYDELRIKVRLAKNKAKEKANDEGSRQTSPETVYTLRIGLFKDQWENVQIALKKAEKMTGSDKLPWQLDCIAMAFNSEAFRTEDEALDEMCRRIERAFGVRLIAAKVEGDKSQIVFGERLAKMVLASPKAVTEKEAKKNKLGAVEP